MLQRRGIKTSLEPVTRHAALIVLLMLVAAASSLLYVALSFATLPYRAEAVILFKGGNSGGIDLTNPGNPGAAGIQNLAGQQKGVQILANSMDVAQMVKVRAAASKEAEIKGVGSVEAFSLQQGITVQVKGDIISVKAEDKSALLATWLANAWAEEAVAKINKVYAAASKDVKRALDKAEADLAAGQQALEQFIAANPIGILSQELTQTQSFIDAATISNNADRLVLYNAERQSISASVSAFYTDTYTLDRQLSEVKALRTRIEQGPDSADALYANQVTLLFALNKLITSGSSPSVQLQLNVSDIGKAPLTTANQLRDVDATIAAIQKIQSDLKSQIRDFESTLSTPAPAAPHAGVQEVPAAFLELISHRNQIESDLEQKKFELNRLQKTRDLSQSTYDLLRTRLAEQSVNEVISSVVAIGSPADYSSTLHSRSILQTLVWAVVQALLIALVLGIAAAYLLRLARPDFSSNAALAGRIRRRKSLKSREGPE